MTVDDLTSRALQLPQAARAELAEKLLESLHSSRTGDETSDEWQAELVRRCEAVHAGRAKLVPAGDVVSALRRKLREAG